MIRTRRGIDQGYPCCKTGPRLRCIPGHGASTGGETQGALRTTSSLLHPEIGDGESVKRAPGQGEDTSLGFFSFGNFSQSTWKTSLLTHLRGFDSSSLLLKHFLDLQRFELLFLDKRTIRHPSPISSRYATFV